MASAATATDTPAKTGSSLVTQLGALVVVTAAAAGIGWFSGGHLTRSEPSAEPQPPAAGQEHGAPAKPEEGAGAKPASLTVMELPAMTTNIAAPADTWVRMELSLVVDEPQDEAIIEAVHQDLLAFVRTVKMHQIEGASGFLHFRQDLSERAAIRSGGHAKEVLIRTLLFE